MVKSSRWWAFITARSVDIIVAVSALFPSMHSESGSGQIPPTVTVSARGAYPT
jgi:hypothetical protein